jgi:hypothetical protein
MVASQSKTMPFIIWMIACVVGIAPAHATTIDPKTFEELVFHSDFVGRVRCVVAGGIVAKYEVIEAWKGESVGAQISIRTATDYWGPQFPIALVGEEFVVAVARSPSSQVTSTTTGGAVPLWWRRIEADYRTPLFQGVARLSASTPSSTNEAGLEPGTKWGRFQPIGRDHSDLARLRADVAVFVALDAETQELRCLRARLARIKDLPAALREPAEGASSIAAFLDVIATADQDPGRESYLAYVTGMAGGERSLDFLRNSPSVDEASREAVVRKLERRLGISKTDAKDPEAEAAVDDARLQEWEGALGRGLKDRAFGKAFNGLSRYRPESVVDWLCEFENSNEEWTDADRGYFLASSFAAQANGDRAACFVRLVSAKDPFVRVVGAVYLAFEDETRGVEELAKLMTLPGDPGGYAALVLASRGDVVAVDRAIELCAHESANNMSGVPHRNLILRLLVLLSNSAAKSGVASPFARDLMDGEHVDIRSARLEENLRAWWNEHRARVTMHDPWFAELEKQKID